MSMRQSLVKRAGLIAVGCLLSCLAYPGYGQEAPASPAETLLQQAFEYVDSCEPQLAEQACEEVIASYPECEYDARLMLAAVYRAQGRLPEAIQQATLALAKVVSLYPDDSQRITAAQEALVHLIAAQTGFTQQRAQHQIIIEEEPGSAEALDAQYRLGGVYAFYFRYDQAIAQLTGLIREHPNSAPAGKAFTILPAVFAQAGRPQEALQVLPELVNRHCSDSPQMLLKLCQFYKKQGKLGQVETTAQRIIDAYPASIEVGGAVGSIKATYLQREGAEGAIARLQGIISSYPETEVAAYAQYQIAQVYEGQGNAEQALAEYEKVVDNYPQSPQAPQGLLRIFHIHREAGRLKRAVSAAQRISTEYPSSSVLSPETLHNLATSCIHQGEYDLAISLYENITKLKDLPVTWYAFAESFVAYCYTEQSEYELAIERYQEIIAKHPTLPERQALAQYKIGYIHLIQGQLEKALAEFQKAVDDYPGASWARRATQRIESIEKRLQETGE